MPWWTWSPGSGQDWRHLESNSGVGGGAPAGQTAGGPASGTGSVAPPPAGSPAEPPAPPPTPPVDPTAHAALALQNARLKARLDFPQADAELLEALTDSAQIAAVAKRTHELKVIQASTPPGAPVPPANAATAAEGEEARKVRELQYKVRQRMRPGFKGGRTVLDPWEAEEARDLFFRLSWNGHQTHRAQGRGNVSEPPRGAPAAVAQPAVLPAPGRAF